MNEPSDLTRRIIGSAMKVHRGLGPGFLESVYHRALIHELCKEGLRFVSERPVPVRYDGVLVGDFTADLVVEDLVIVEIKAASDLAPAHEIQLVNYLTATGIDVGLLLNFGASSLQFHKKFRLPKGNMAPRPGRSREDGQDSQD
jgi:GxxExxY protein